MTTDFERALAITLKFEGGWYAGNLPGDPNPTMRGVIQKTYDAWRKEHGFPTRSVREIADDELADIYRRKFWEKASCGLESWPLNALMFDWAVNSGPKHALNGLIRVFDDPKLYLEVRWAFLENLMAKRPSTRVFRKGWARRVNALCKVAGVPSVAKEKV
jgi:lysozyme family protein